MHRKLTLTLLLAGALFTMGAKWAETPIEDVKSVAGTWKGTYVEDGKKFPVRLIIEEDGSYQGEDPHGVIKGTLKIKGGKILYQSADQRTFTLTLLARKKKRLLQGNGDQGEVKVSLKPAKTKHAKRKRKKKTKLSLANAKQITAGFEGVTLAPPPRTANDVLLLFDKSALFDLDCSNWLHPTEEEVRDQMRAMPPVKSGQFTRVHFAADRAQAEFYAGNYPLSVKYTKWAINAIPSDLLGGLAGQVALLAIYQAYAGDFDDAKKSASRALISLRRARWSGSQWNLARVKFAVTESQAAVAASKGRLDKAGALYRDALTIAEDNFLWERVNFTTLALAKNLMRQGRLLEAENVVRKVLHGLDAQADSALAATATLRFSEVLYEQGRYNDAEAVAQTTVKLFQNACVPPENLQLATARDVLARSLLAQRRWQEALAEYEAIQVSMERDPESFQRLFVGNLYRALAMLHSGRTQEAAQDLRMALERAKDRLGEKHYRTAEIRGFLAIIQVAKGAQEEALAGFANATKILLTRSRESDDDSTTFKARDQRLILILESYIGLLTDIRGSAVERNARVDAIAEAFRIADTARSRSVQRALAASSARATLNDAALADLVRREQDAQKRIAVLYGTLAKELSRPSHEQSFTRIAGLRTTIDRLRDARGTLMEEIESRFPAYSNLINPKAPSLREIRASLGPGEALIATYVGEDRTYVWAVPHEGDVAFAEVLLSRTELQARVEILRRALDPQAATLGDIPPFDVKMAYALYAALLKPVEAGWRHAQNLLIVAHGTLGQLPLSVLPTKPVELGKQRKPLFSRYQKVPWLARTHAVTVLPSVSSLLTLRSLPPGPPRRRAYAGFGDPYFSEAQAKEARAEGTGQVVQVATRGLTVRGLPLQRRSVPQTRALDSAALAKLPRLPETADEVKSIALALNADLATDVFVGALASETQVKTMDLSDRKVIAFATHGLVPGDLDGLTQPALALSSPAVTGGKDDGLLTMGEILGLKLNADWVVLSACNTAAADGAGAEAISGLGRAFFYAGARALLVSNWPVETTSAKALTTDLFRRQAKDPTLTRAQALQQAMLALIDGPGRTDAQGKTLFSYAHPIFWAPFTLVGDGG